MRYVEDAIPAGEKIRVLVVDDSMLMRRMISRVFETDLSIALVGVACNGIEAIPELRPHVVALDVEMPEMDGMETLREIVGRFPAVRVVMLSKLTEQGAQITIDALMHGANDYVTKPSPSHVAGFDALATDRLFKVKQFFPRSRDTVPSLPVASIFRPQRSGTPAEVCAIGVSTGGPSALLDALPMFPAVYPLPIVIVQHMPVLFTQLLADRLNGVCAIAVVEGRDGMILRPGVAVIAPGGFHMRVVRSGGSVVIQLDEGPKENSCRPAADVLFRSIVEAFDRRSIAAILTGMGRDGLAGAQLLKARGAAILAQDRASSVVWGMPGAVVAANLADAVLPLNEIVPEILRRSAAR